MSIQKTQLFKTVEIIPQNKKWEIRFLNLEGERECIKTKPNPLGFYHYSAEKSELEAFEELRSCMAKEHIERIIKLQESLIKLMKLNANDFI